MRRLVLGTARVKERFDSSGPCSRGKNRQLQVPRSTYEIANNKDEEQATCLAVVSCGMCAGANTSASGFTSRQGTLFHRRVVGPAHIGVGGHKPSIATRRHRAQARGGGPQDTRRPLRLAVEVFVATPGSSEGTDAPGVVHECDYKENLGHDFQRRMAGRGMITWQGPGAEQLPPPPATFRGGP